jgi:8-oxo-dGTP pyrophosphatase MutT (NUDIX family)
MAQMIEKSLMLLIPIEWLNGWRNFKGRYDLLRFLFKWDPDYRKDIMIAAMSFTLCVYSIFTWNNFYDTVALILEFGLLYVAFGADMSILPVDYRPNYNGVSYSAQPGVHVVWDELSIPMAALLPAPSEEKIGFRNPIEGKGLSQETPFVSDAVDDQLMMRDVWPYEEISSDKSLIVSRHQLRYLAIKIANKKQHTTNGVKFSLCGLADMLTGDRPLQVRKSCYFDALLTEEAFRSRIFRGNISGEKEVYTDMSTYFPAKYIQHEGHDAARLTDDFHEHVASQIGITTVLITENRRVAMLRQGGNKVIGSQAVFFGGSGSLDYADRPACRDPKNFKEIIRHGMARETVEETGMRHSYLPRILDNTMLTGFFRWVDRCGKPEFVGVTRAGGIPFFGEKAIDRDEVVSFEEIPVTINKLEDIKEALEYVRVNNMRTGLSSMMALYRLATISEYNRPDATETQKEIYQRMSKFILEG